MDRQSTERFMLDSQRMDTGQFSMRFSILNELAKRKKEPEQ